jgi:outer membrane lipoprotein
MNRGATASEGIFVDRHKVFILFRKHETERPAGEIKGLLRLPVWAYFSVSGFLLFPLFSGCTPILKEWREKADPKLTFAEVFQQPEAFRGKVVIWDGEIIRTINEKEKNTLIEVLQKPLNRSAAPKERGVSGGKIFSHGRTFFSPYLYRTGREITVAGKILGEDIKPLGKMAYRYPLLLGKQVYLWRGYSYHYPPYYYPYGPGWD